MPVRQRVPKTRRPTFSVEALDLFRKLDGRPWLFEDGSRELARLLGLSAQWWTGNSSLDKSRSPCHPPGCLAHDDWHRCREVRRQLLDAAKGVRS